jgi:hypothetical protein
VLKQAGELSSSANKGNISEKPISSVNSNSNLNNIAISVVTPQLDITNVNVPDYPDQTPRRGPLKPAGPNLHQRHGLAAPAPDISSSSGPMRSMNFLYFFFFKIRFFVSLIFFFFVNTHSQQHTFFLT